MGADSCPLHLASVTLLCVGEVHPRCVQACASFLFMAEQYPSAWMDPLCLSIHPLVNIWVVSIFGIVPFRTFVDWVLCGQMLSSLLGMSPKWNYGSDSVTLGLTYRGTKFSFVSGSAVGRARLVVASSQVNHAHCRRPSETVCSSVSTLHWVGTRDPRQGLFVRTMP